MAAISKIKLHASLPIPNLSIASSPPSAAKSPPFTKLLAIPSGNSEAQSYHDESNIFEEIRLVCVLPAGDTLQLLVNSGETVQEIKRKLDAVHGIPFSTSSLHHNGKLMMDPLSLNDFPGLLAKSPLSLSEGGNTTVTLQVKLTPVVTVKETPEVPIVIPEADIHRSLNAPDDAGMEHAYATQSSGVEVGNSLHPTQSTVHILADSSPVSTPGNPLPNDADPALSVEELNSRLSPLSLAAFGSVKSISHIYFDAVERGDGDPLDSYSSSLHSKSYSLSQSESQRSDRTAIDVVDDLGDPATPPKNGNHNDDRRRKWQYCFLL